MYKIIGANQSEYGPVSAEQIRQWIAEGRINGQTPAQAVGEAGWKPIASFPEFAASFPSAPPQPPPLNTPQPIISPFASPAGRQGALNEVNGPAIGLMVAAILGIFAELGGVVWNLFGGSFANFGNFQGMPQQNAQMLQMMQSMTGTMGVVFGCLKIAMAIFVFYGALKMKSLQSHTLCIVAGIIAVIPCTSPCCCVGIPIGIWALIVLNKAEVREHFN